MLPKMSVLETIQQKVIHLPPQAQQQVLVLVEQLEARSQPQEHQPLEHPLDLLAELTIDAPPDLATRHDFYAHGKAER
jgi:hypothetical protein